MSARKGYQSSVNLLAPYHDATCHLKPVQSGAQRVFLVPRSMKAKTNESFAVSIGPDLSTGDPVASVSYTRWCSIGRFGTGKLPKSLSQRISRSSRTVFSIPRSFSANGPTGAKVPAEQMPIMDKASFTTTGKVPRLKARRRGAKRR